jgi:hypothetical protein
MKYETIRNIQLSLFPEEENAEMSGSAEKLHGVGGKSLFIGKGITRPKRAEILIKRIKKSEIRRGGQEEN